MTYLHAIMRKHGATLTVAPIDPKNEAFGWKATLEMEFYLYYGESATPGAALLVLDRIVGKLYKDGAL